MRTTPTRRFADRRSASGAAGFAMDSTTVAMSVPKIMERVTFFSQVAASQTWANGPLLARMLWL
jgi:hypothetical protein